MIQSFSNTKENSNSLSNIFQACNLILDTQASNLTVECDGNGNIAQLNNWLNTRGNAFAISSCNAPITWTHNFTQLTPLCGNTGFATVTFTATDNRGNRVQTIATFTIEDNLAPSIVGFPSTISNNQPSCVGTTAFKFCIFQ
ncbi:MAG: hypothetical protein HC854_18095 [Flavobacterium sp.]|nr:hypothetical protein [Flavobacterium sp.]